MDNGTYTVELRVSDSLLTDTAETTVTVIDLGPEAGERGGQIAAEGPPEEVVRRAAAQPPGKAKGGRRKAAKAASRQLATLTTEQKDAALLAIADKDNSLLISGNGDVIEPESGLIAIGSGGPFAQSAAMAYLADEKVMMVSRHDRNKQPVPFTDLPAAVPAELTLSSKPKSSV